MKALDEKRVFGTKKPGVQYTSTLSTYAVIFNLKKDQVGILWTDEHYVLPGGEMVQNESDIECLQRKIKEEIGANIEVGCHLGNAADYYYSPRDSQYVRNEGDFYLGKLSRQEEHHNHMFEWMSPNEAIEKLWLDHQKWAVQEGVNVMQTSSLF